MKIAPISIYDIAAQQAWLEDLAAKGEFLFEHKGAYATFYKGEPKTVRYRLQPTVKKGTEPEEEQKDIYLELGWKYICSTGEFQIWCSEDPSAPELDTDPQVQAAAYDRLCRQLRRSNWICGGIVLFPILLVLVFHFTVNNYAARLAGSWVPMWEAAIVFVTLSLVCSQLIWWQYSLRRFLRTLKAGIPMPHRRPYGKSRAMCALMWVVYIVFLISRFIVLLEPNSRSFEPVETFGEPVPYVEIAGAEDVEAIRWKNWQTKEQWWVLQGEWNSDNAESHYYEFYLPWQAKRIAVDIAEQENLQPVESTADGAWWKRNEQYDYETLVVWDGARVVEVTYSGENSITEYLEDYAALVSE